MLYVNQSIEEIDRKIHEAASKIDEAIELLSEVHHTFAYNFTESVISEAAGYMADMLFDVEYFRHLIYAAIDEVKRQQAHNK